MSASDSDASSGLVRRAYAEMAAGLSAIVGSVLYLTSLGDPLFAWLATHKSFYALGTLLGTQLAPRIGIDPGTANLLVIASAGLYALVLARKLLRSILRGLWQTLQGD